MDPTTAIDTIAQSQSIDPDDLVIEIRKGGRTSVVAYVDKERILLAQLRSPEELQPYVEGLTTPRKKLTNVVSTDGTTT